MRKQNRHVRMLKFTGSLHYDCWKMLPQHPQYETMKLVINKFSRLPLGESSKQIVWECRTGDAYELRNSEVQPVGPRIPEADGMFNYLGIECSNSAAK